MSQVMKTPQSNFSGPIVVDPLTRIEGHLRIEVEVENGRIKDARSCGTLYRGLEVILKGRDPRDAQHFTQRTCGVCTYTHALASTRALEDAMGLTLPANATYIRNLVLGLLFPSQVGILCPYVTTMMMFQTFANSLGSSVQDLARVLSHPKPVLVIMLTLHILRPRRWPRPSRPARPRPMTSRPCRPA